MACHNERQFRKAMLSLFRFAPSFHLAIYAYNLYACPLVHPSNEAISLPIAVIVENKVFDHPFPQAPTPPPQPSPRSISLLCFDLLRWEVASGLISS